ncbi:hypothetical protein RI367_001174 [Sorochytrium milnesiophthora]
MTDGGNNTPVLYTYWRSSCSWRVRIALNLKNIQYEPSYVNLVKSEQTSDAYKAVNPSQSIPALKIDGHTLTQSMAILEYLEETRPEAPLLPKDPAQRALVRSIAHAIAGDIQPLQNMRVQVLHGKKVAEASNGALDAAAVREEWTRHWISLVFTGIEKTLQKSAGKYCVGDNVTLADVCLVPQMYGAKRVNVDMSAFPTIQRVHDALVQLDAFVRADADHQGDNPERA